MKNKIALLIASLVSGVVFGLMLYVINPELTVRDYVILCSAFAFAMFLFELYITPIIKRKYRKDN